MSRPIGLQSLLSPPAITISSRCALGGAISRMGVGAAASGISPWSDAANCLLAFPFVIEQTTTFYKGFAVAGATNAGNTEVGIWDSAYNKIVTTGSWLMNGGASLPQSVALSATTKLPPGLYYAGIAHDSTTTLHFFRWSVATIGIAFWQGAGCWRQSGITLGSLAATATPGDITNVAFPVYGLITRSVFDV